MKTLTIVIALFLCSGCLNTDRKKTPSKKIAENKYEFIERFYTNHIVLTPEIKTTRRQDGDIVVLDLFTSRELLRSLDTSLLNNSFLISVCSESVRSPEGDTLQISIYDFICKQNDHKITDLFKNNPFRQSSLDVFEAPIGCLFFLNKGNLCGVCQVGFNKSGIIKNDLFVDYIEQQTDNRINNRRI